MFFFFRSKKQHLFSGLVDFHNHILPNVDDGCKSINESLNMLDEYSTLGFREVIPSPHTNHIFPNDSKKLKKSFNKFLLEPKVQSHEIIIKKLASEYLIGDEFYENLKKKENLIKFNEKYLLIEIPFFGKLNILNEVIYSLTIKDIIPILAHPERFAAYENKSFVQDLKIRGVLMQLNALSLIGRYGEMSRKKAFKWLNEGLYDFVGTDAHNLNQLQSVHKIKLNKKETIQWNKIKKNQIKVFS